MSPLCTQKGRHIGLLLTPHFYVTSVLFVSVRSVLSVYHAGGQTRVVDPMAGYCWPNVYDISPVLSDCVMFDATLHVGQRHRRRANINTAFVQSIVGYYSQHEVNWLRLNGYWPAPATLAQHLPDIRSVSACTAWPAAQQTQALNQCCFYAGPASQTVGQNWVNVSCLLGV